MRQIEPGEEERESIDSQEIGEEGQESIDSLEDRSFIWIILSLCKKADDARPNGVERPYRPYEFAVGRRVAEEEVCQRRGCKEVVEEHNNDKSSDGIHQRKYTCFRHFIFSRNRYCDVSTCTW